MPSTFHRLLLPGIALAIQFCAPTTATARPAACPDGRFLLPAGAAFAGSPTPGTRQGITLANRQLAIDGVCPPARAKIKAGRKATAVSARWRTCGDLRKVAFAGRITAPACATLRGTLRAKTRRPTTTDATRSACGDGYADRAAGETCDLPTDGGGVPTTLSPGGTTTTTTPPGGGTTTTTLPGGGSGSEPTPASLDAARDAIAAGGTDVPLSPDGTLRLVRIATPAGGIDIIARDGVPLVRWEHDGDVTEMVADTDADGVPELHLTGRRAPVRSAVVRYDLDGDGVIERTLTMTQVAPDGVEAEIAEAGRAPIGFSAPLLQEVSAGPLPAGGAVTSTGCTAAQEAAAKTALTDALATGLQCLRDLGLDSIAKAIEGKVARDGVTVRCGGTTDCAQIDILDSITRGLLPMSVGITLGPDFLAGSGVCTKSAMILFHELLHLALGEIHSPFLDRSTFEGLATDRVYSCTDLCFRPQQATKSECAKCLGVDRCDAKCAKFQDGSEGPCDLFVDITGITCPRQSCQCCDGCPGGINWASKLTGDARGPIGTILQTTLPRPPDGDLTCSAWTPVTCPGAAIDGTCCERKPGNAEATAFAGESRQPPAVNPQGCICPPPPPPTGVAFVAKVIAPDGRELEDQQTDICP